MKGKEIAERRPRKGTFGTSAIRCARDNFASELAREFSTDLNLRATDRGARISPLFHGDAYQRSKD